MILMGCMLAGDGRFLFATLSKKYQVAVVSCTRHKIIATYSVRDPIGVLTSPDGKRLYISTRENPSVVVVDVVNETE